MADLNSSPVSLGAGSYDYDALKDGLDAAAAAPADKYDAAVSSTLSALDATGLAKVDPRQTPGYEFVEVQRELEDGAPITETIQVFAGGAAAQKAELDAAKADAGKGGTKSDGKDGGK